MGQHEILDALKQNGGWMTTKDLIKVVEASQNSVNSCLRRLKKHKFVDFKGDRPVYYRYGKFG
ncbi:MAG: hypothetical protein CL811_06540 [Colwelliaceae bacterium]|jgi:DNA-binding IclR family transcriptional regulator|nr:hypothetical protein [Colwelliaceae bacterium]|tara:strand:- start:912 stop:1100 length:189 start_codon:yes stop_codon:yes gene_type:complete